MSNLNQRIRDFSAGLPDKENIDINSFLSQPGNKVALNDWIYKYRTPKTAETAFKRKLSGIHKKMPKKRQKSLKGDANWERLLEDAQTQQSYMLNSSRLLRSSGRRVANELIEAINEGNSEVETRENGQPEINSEDETHEEGEMREDGLPERNRNQQVLNVGSLPTRHFHLESGTDITPLWHYYKLISEEKACKEGLSLVSDLHKALSLSHILLLVSQSHDKDMVSLFGADILSSLYREIHGMYIDNEIEFDMSYAKKIKQVLKNLKDGSLTRVKAAGELVKLMENLSNEDATIIQSIINCVIKLPAGNTTSKIGEMELITNYLDPVLSPMFHQPDNNKLFKWLNLKTKESRKADLQYRPDGCMVLNEQLNDVYALGFCEVKSIDAINRHSLTHTDTFRLAMFAKSAIDNHEIKCTLAVQSIGTYITFFLCSLQAEAVYPFIKLERINIPISIDELPDFIAHLDTCKQIISTYNKFCVPLGREERTNLRRQSLTQQQIDDIVTEHRAGESPSIKYN